MTVTATTTDGSAPQSFVVTVEGPEPPEPTEPKPPEPVGAMGDLSFAHGDPAATVASLDAFFANVDGAEYTATSSVPAVATVSVDGTTLTVTPNAQPAGTTGETTVTVTATTTDGSAPQSFVVTVAGPPEPPKPPEPTCPPFAPAPTAGVDLAGTLQDVETGLPGAGVVRAYDSAWTLLGESIACDDGRFAIAAADASPGEITLQGCVGHR